MKKTVAIVALAGVLVTGCSDGGGGGGSTAGKAPLDVVLAAADTTAEAKSAKIAVTVDLKDVAGVPGGAMKVTGEGAFDFAGRRGSLVMDLPDVSGQQLGEMTVVMDGDVVYQKFPPQLAASLGGKQWLKIDLKTAGDELGVDISSLTGGQSSDPTQALAFLRGASSDIAEVGKEDLRGAKTTHYRATIDMRKAAEAAPEAQRAALGKVAELYGDAPVPADVWVDEKGRLRKMAFTVDLARMGGAAGGQASGTMATTMEYFDFGTEVEVDVPPADQVADITTLRQSPQQ